MFGLHRRERIAFCEKFGGARLGRLKEGLECSKKTHVSEKKTKNGRGECVFGRHRRERIAFLAENGQAWLRRSKASPTRSKPMHFSDKGLKNTPKRDGRKRVWTAQA
jgi:hypothetical protein